MMNMDINDLVKMVFFDHDIREMTPFNGDYNIWQSHSNPNQEYDEDGLKAYSRLYYPDKDSFHGTDTTKWGYSFTPKNSTEMGMADDEGLRVAREMARGNGKYDKGKGWR